MRRFSILGFFILINSLHLLAQKKAYNDIDKQALAIPKSMEASTDLIAQYINQKFNNENDKIRAAFIWVVKNISYDIKQLRDLNDFKGTQHLIEETLSQRKAVCHGYATLFNDIALKLGINSYIVSGYTKQNGKVDSYSHAWCIANINSAWYIFDPTWGSGNIVNETTYIKSLNNSYFKAEPKDIIQTHMPFDPLWQCLQYPITHQAFYEGKTEMDSSGTSFNYINILNDYEKQSKLKQFTSSLQRIRSRAIKNSLIERQIRYLTTEIAFYQNHNNVEKFNIAIDHYNAAAKHFNEFIIYRNKGFKPPKEADEIRAMVDDIQNRLQQAERNLQLNNPEKQLQESAIEVFKQMNDLAKKTREQQKFLNKYFK